MREVARESCSDWAARIRACRPEGLRWIFKYGALLIAAKADVPHGSWEEMLRDAGENPRTARKFMAIADNAWLAGKSDSRTVLPHEWTTLYELSQLPETTLEMAAADGLIRPDMDRIDVLALKRPQLPAVPPPAAAEGGGRYRAILADPPWHFATWSERGQQKSPSRHYRTLTFDEICALPVGDLAADDSALFLWTTFARLPDALKVIEHWGFRYVTGGPWYKRSPTNRKWAFGTGYVLRDAAECFLIGFRGRPPVNGKGERNLIDEAPGIEAARREHSRKPDALYSLIETLLPGGPFVELFARQVPRGWDCWGDEVGKFDIETPLS